jgi:molybdopterin synthase catalytic subunit
LPPVSGGAPGYEEGVFEIHPEPLDPERARRRVAHPSCGAAVVFVGSTRDHNRGERVVRLDYEAFEAMAGAEMGRIFARARALHAEAELRMLAVHRTGTVGVGEPSVAIAVASPHRDAAFEVARFLIDELKKSVPLWKKEIYADGHHWINDRS